MSIGKKVVKTIYLKNGGVATNGGTSYDAAKPIASGDLWSIPAGFVVDRVYVILDVLVTGTTNLDVGDDDDADGFVDGSLSVTLGTAGMYGWDAKSAGAYLRVQTAGVTDAADIYVVPSAKYYAAATKTLKLATAGTNTAGKVRVVVEGFYAGAKS